MKVNRIGKVALAALSFRLVAAGAWASAPPLVQKNCMKCHEKLVKSIPVLRKVLPKDISPQPSPFLFPG